MTQHEQLPPTTLSELVDTLIENGSEEKAEKHQQLVEEFLSDVERDPARFFNGELQIPQAPSEDARNLYILNERYPEALKHSVEILSGALEDYDIGALSLSAIVHSTITPCQVVQFVTTLNTPKNSESPVILSIFINSHNQEDISVAVSDSTRLGEPDSPGFAAYYAEDGTSVLDFQQAVQKLFAQ